YPQQGHWILALPSRMSPGSKALLLEHQGEITQVKWSRVSRRIETMIIAACPAAVRDEISAARVTGELENVVHRTGSKDVEKAPKDVNPAGSAKDLEVAKRALTAPLLITGSQYPLRSDLSDAGTVEEVSQQQIKSMLADAAHILQQAAPSPKTVQQAVPISTAPAPGVSPNTCPYMQEDQALKLIAELETTRLRDFEKSVQAMEAELQQIANPSDPSEAVRKYLCSGGRNELLRAVFSQPYLRPIPEAVKVKLCEGLPGISDSDGWKILKRLPLNRARRRALHASKNWLVYLGSGQTEEGDPLKLWAQQKGLEFLGVDIREPGGRGWDLSTESGVWSVLLWGALQGRVAVILSTPPYRTWGSFQANSEGRSLEDPWATLSTDPVIQRESLLAVQDLLLWSISSVWKEFQHWARVNQIRFSQGSLGMLDVDDPFKELPGAPSEYEPTEPGEPVEPDTLPDLEQPKEWFENHQQSVGTQALATQLDTPSEVEHPGAEALDDSEKREEEYEWIDDEPLEEEIQKLTSKVEMVTLRFFVGLKSKTGADVTAGIQQMIIRITQQFPLRILHCDPGTEFTSDALARWLPGQGVKLQTTIPTDKQGNGLAERVVGWFKEEEELVLSAPLEEEEGIEPTTPD
ncbi:GIP, partial [Symbiodinium microadriaticum]